MSVMIGIAGKGDVEAIFQTDEPLHGIGEDGSMRIFPSQSKVMKRNVGSTASFTTVRSSR